MVEAINQADCAECDGDLGFRQNSREYDMSEPADAYVKYGASCQDCGASGEVTISGDGLSVEGSISHEDASWNDS